MAGLRWHDWLLSVGQNGCFYSSANIAAYESGYLGFAPQRELAGLGVECVVAAVSRVPRSAADFSSKNDRNDAARMAKVLALL